MNNIDFNISELAEGAVQEKIDQEVRKIVANILDVNTAFKPSRKLIIDVEFSSDKTDVGVPVDEIEGNGVIDFNARKIK